MSPSPPPPATAATAVSCRTPTERSFLPSFLHTISYNFISAACPTPHCHPSPQRLYYLALSPLTACPLPSPAPLKGSTHNTLFHLIFLHCTAFLSMGCIHSTDSTRSYRVNSVAMPLRPSTPSFHAKDLTQQGVSTTGSRTNNETKDDVPSFVVSNSADLVGSSDGEMVYGMVRTFTFSYIQASETSSTHSSLGDVSYTPDEELTSPAGAPGSLSALIVGGDPIVELTPIPEERLNRKGGGNGRATGSTATKADASSLSSSSGTENGESSIGSDL